METPHLDDNALEAYALGHMSAEIKHAADEHLLTCELCRHGVTGEDRFLRTMRAALGDDSAS